jgi:hypothetical protein
MPELRITDIIVRADIQPRANSLNQGHVGELLEAINRGASLPPVVVYRTQANQLLLSEGFHRLEAHRRSGQPHIAAEVRDGSEVEAKLNAMASNQGHGLKRTNEDKRRAIAEVLSIKPDWSDTAIGKHLGVDHKTVGDERAIMERRREIPTSPTRTDAKGREQPAKKPRPKPSTPVQSPEPVNQSARADHDDTENSSTPVHPLPVELPELTEYDPILETEQTREPTGARPLPEFDDYSAKMYKFAEEKVGWRSRWDRVIRQFRAMIEELDAIAGGPSGHHLRNLADRDGNRLWKPVVVQKGVQRYTITMYQPLLDAVVMLVKTRPDAVCAACGGRECPACRQSGFTPAGGFDAKEQQQELFGNDTNPWD